MSASPILVIDDDPAILSTVTDILEYEGYEVMTATNGLDGLRCLDERLPFLIILDMRMEGMDGWGFAQSLQGRGIELPILVMTAAQDARRWAQEIDAAAYLAKPFDLVELLDAVAKLAG